MKDLLRCLIGRSDVLLCNAGSGRWPCRFLAACGQLVAISFGVVIRSLAWSLHSARTIMLWAGCARAVAKVASDPQHP